MFWGSVFKNEEHILECVYRVFLSQHRAVRATSITAIAGVHIRLVSTVNEQFNVYFVLHDTTLKIKLARKVMCLYKV